MRFASVGLLMTGPLFVAAALIPEDGMTAFALIVIGGFLFVAGAIFAGAVAICDTLRMRG